MQSESSQSHEIWAQSADSSWACRKPRSFNSLNFKHFFSNKACRHSITALDGIHLVWCCLTANGFWNSDLKTYLHYRHIFPVYFNTGLTPLNRDLKTILLVSELFHSIFWLICEIWVYQIAEILNLYFSPCFCFQYRLSRFSSNTLQTITWKHGTFWYFQTVNVIYLNSVTNGWCRDFFNGR